MGPAAHRALHRTRLGQVRRRCTCGEPRERLSCCKSATFRALHTPPPGSDYAGGWIVVERSWAGGLAPCRITAVNTSWYASIWMAPARDFAVFVATNQGGTRGDMATRPGRQQADRVARFSDAATDGQTLSSGAFAARRFTSKRPCLVAFQVDLAPGRVAAHGVGPGHLAAGKRTE